MVGQEGEASSALVLGFRLLFGRLPFGLAVEFGVAVLEGKSGGADLALARGTESGGSETVAESGGAETAVVEDKAVRSVLSLVRVGLCVLSFRLLATVFIKGLELALSGEEKVDGGDDVLMISSSYRAWSNIGCDS